MPAQYPFWKKTAPKPKKGSGAAASAEFVPDAAYKQLICSQSYIGKRGYTIPKSVLKKEDEEILRKELYVKPQLFGINLAGGGEETAFAVYRESSQKMYIPRFYGIERYGQPARSELSEGMDIHVPFAKELRDYQENIISIYVNHVTINSECGGGILEVPCGRGKTVMGLKIISILKKKTLILVHKEFLMNQWIERIGEFLPTAKVGKIQGPTVDVDGKDIVIGMIQSIYDKEYPSDLFSQFGLTVVDEVHRIGSEQFSKTLLKVVTPYMLGISATVDRKDKLTNVLYMFIGNKIYSETRKEDDPVMVRAIEYVSNCSEFNDTEYDFRGNPQYSKMIVKLCDYGPRSDFIIRVLQDLIHENPENQIMVIGHNRSLLTYLHDAIEHKKIASVGYYVGGMKQQALQNSESKQIVVCSYAMASEGLDIKTLSTLVMVTPKTDIIQTAGRILRMKHQNPIIVDFVDKHDLFQKQWMQRFRFYKKCNYRVRKISSTDYTNMNINWNKDTTWKKVFEPKNGAAACSAATAAPGSSSSGEDDEEDNPKSKAAIGTCLIDFEDTEVA